MYKTLIFDLDGTLLDTLEDLTDAVNVVLSAHGFPRRAPTDVRAALGNGLRRLAALSLPVGTEEAVVEQVYTELKDYYVNHCRIKTAPYPGILPLLERLQSRGCQLAIVSNKADPAVQALAEAHFKGYISAAVGERPNVRKKPAPDTVLAVLEQLDASKESSLYIGDSEVDAETARNAGLDCVLVDWGFRDREDLLRLDALAVISSPDALLDYCEIQEL